jgi:hypothetical protein
VALVNVSSRSTWAQASLTETLTVMSARFLSEACVTLPLTRTKIDEACLIADPEIATALRSALAVFVRAIEATEPR